MNRSEELDRRDCRTVESRACQIESSPRLAGFARQSPIRRRLSFLSLAPAALSSFAPAFSVMRNGSASALAITQANDDLPVPLSTVIVPGPHRAGPSAPGDWGRGDGSSRPEAG